MLPPDPDGAPPTEPAARPPVPEVLPPEPAARPPVPAAPAFEPPVRSLPALPSLPPAPPVPLLAVPPLPGVSLPPRFAPPPRAVPPVPLLPPAVDLPLPPRPVVLLALDPPPPPTASGSNSDRGSSGIESLEEHEGKIAAPVSAIASPIRRFCIRLPLGERPRPFRPAVQAIGVIVRKRSDDRSKAPRGRDDPPCTLVAVPGEKHLDIIVIFPTVRRPSLGGRLFRRRVDTRLVTNVCGAKFHGGGSPAAFGTPRAWPFQGAG